MVLNKIICVQEFLKKAGIVVSGTVIIIMMFFILLDVLLRNVTGSSIPGGYNYVEKYFMPFIVFPLLAFVYSSGILPRLDVFVDKFSKTKMVVINLIMRIVDLVLFSLMFYYSLKYMVTGTIQGVAFSAGGALAPLAPSLIITTFGFLILFFEIVLAIYKTKYNFQSNESKSVNN